jgi:hypothetical protein
MLGTTPDEAADAIRARKIKGKVGSPNCCPVSNFLHEMGFKDVSCDYDGIHADGEVVMMPMHLIQLIAAFDLGTQHQDLKG